jgi:hypothetical protein
MVFESRLPRHKKNAFREERVLFARIPCRMLNLN